MKSREDENSVKNIVTRKQLRSRVTPDRIGSWEDPKLDYEE